MTRVWVPGRDRCRTAWRSGNDGVLASGDALVTGHPLLARRGPQLLPALFSHDQDACLRSLNALALLNTAVLAPGHGDVWRGPIQDAVEHAS